VNVANNAGAGSIAVLRVLFLSISSSVVVLGVVVAVLEAGDAVEPTVSTPAAALGVLGAGVLLLIASRTVPPAIDCRDPATVVRSFQARFIVRLALTEAPVLVGFVGYLLGRSPVAYLLGAAISVVGFVFAAPSDANLEREQVRLDRTGCSHRLVDLLRGSPAG
jgi:hypothetical protein